MKFQRIYIPLIIIGLLTLMLQNAKAQSEATAAFANLRMEVHDNIVIYKDKSSPKTVGNNAFFIYIVKPNTGSPYLKCEIQYSGYTPIWATSYILKPDKQNPNTFFSITPDFIEKGSDVRPTYSHYWSWCDITVGINLMNTLHEIVKSENPKLQYIGSMDNLETKISKKEVKAIENVLAAYGSLK